MSRSNAAIDEAFEVLNVAKKMEEELLERQQEEGVENDRRGMEVVAARYLEACDLLGRALSMMDASPPGGSEKKKKKKSSSSSSSRRKLAEDDKVRELLKEKMRFYIDHAHKLMNKDKNSEEEEERRDLSVPYTPAKLPVARLVVEEEEERNDWGTPRQLNPSSSDVSELTAPASPAPSVRFGCPSASSSVVYHPYMKEVTDMAGTANNFFSRALDLDEQGERDQAVQEYKKAAKLLIDAIGIIETKQKDDPNGSSSAWACSTGAALKKRVEGIIDRIEQLKESSKKNRSSISLKSLKKMSSRSISSSNNNNEHHNEQRDKRAAASSAAARLTKDEIDVLKRSSQITSGLFLPWMDDEVQRFDFRTRDKSKPWTDPEGMLKLSEAQQKQFYKWARPQEVLNLRMGGSGGSASGRVRPVMVKAITPYSIRQKAVTDCSFIASLCICSAYERRFKRRLVTSLIYPQDRDGIPIYNPYGKYMVKLWLNGVARRVIVDDLLPVDNDGNLLCSHTKSHTPSELELWVSIIEKAYMKLCGGYDFPGSNSGVDLFSLTGWIPERIYFPEKEGQVLDFETPTERAWERLYNASNVGDCLITVSTSSKLSEGTAEDVGLVTGHAYAVLNVVQTSSGSRLLQLKNPWAHKGWKGKYSPHDETSWADANLRSELGYNPEEASKFDDGVFWIGWDDILLYFNNVHLSWNPSLFESRITVHGFWPKDKGPMDDSYNVGENPQYIMTLSDDAIQRKATIWILLSRHVTAQEQEGSEAQDYLTLHVHRNQSNKDQIIYPSKKTCVLRGAYTNNPHVLIRYDVMGAEDKYLSLVFSQYKKSNDLGYTMSCYCTSGFVLGTPAKTPAHVMELPSQWTDETAGGNPASPRFRTNPTWEVHVPHGGTFMQLKCLAEKSLAVNVMLIRVDGADVASGFRLTDDALVTDTGDYRHGYAATGVISVPAGTYALVASTFKEGELGNFVLKVCCSTKRVTVTPVVFN